MANNSDTKLRITADASGATLAFRTLEQSVSSSTRKFFEFNNLAGTLGGALTVTAFSGFMKKSIDLQDNLAVLSEKTGTTVEALAGLKYAAEQNDTSLEAVALSAKKLSTNLSANPELFKQLGITAKDTTGAMVQLADLFASMPDGVTKSALAVKLMGKSGEEMIPFMNQGGESLRKFIEQGQKIYPITTENAKAAREFNDQMQALGAAASGFGISLSNMFLPSLVETTTRMNELSQSGHEVMALWRGLAGMGKVPWDLLMPPEDLKKSLSADGMVKDLQAQIGQLERNKQSGNGWLMRKIFGTPQEIDAEIAMLKQRIDTIKKHAEELDKKNTPAAAQKVIPKKVTDLLNAGGSRGDGIVANLETDFKNSYEKKLRDLNAVTMSAVDKQFADNLAEVSIRAAKAREEIDKLNISTAQKSELFARVNEDEKKQIALMEDLRKKTEELNASWEHGAAVSMRKYLDEVTNTAKQSEQLVTGAFKGMEDSIASFYRNGSLNIDAFKNSVLNMMAQIAAQKTMTGLMGLFGVGGSSWQSASSGNAGLDYAGGYTQASFAGGGYTGSGPRSGGLDGMGGFLAVMHPQETVIDHARGQRAGGVNVTYAPVIQIDARTDQAQVQQLVSNAVRQGNAELVDRLGRQGAL